MMHFSNLSALLAGVLPLAAAQTGSRYYGCYTEADGYGTSGRALERTITDEEANFGGLDGMTLSACETYCTQQRDYSFWGVEFGGECYCGDSLKTGSFRTFDGSCNMECRGDPGQTCGGEGVLDLYGRAELDAPADQPVPLPGDAEFSEFMYLGCFAETAEPRILSQRSANVEEMDVWACALFCRKSGFLVFGVEFGTECYCGDGNDREEFVYTQKVDQRECGMTCQGDGRQTCGGDGTVDVYEWVD